MLPGKRIAITRAAEQTGDLAERLLALGAEPLVCPTIATALADPGPLDATLDRLAAYDWLVLASANAVRALLARMAARGMSGAGLAHLRIAAVGPATAAALAAYGLRTHLAPAEHSAAGLLAEIGDLAGARVLLPQADIARPHLADGLGARGAQVDAVTAYRTVPGPGAAALLAELRAGDMDAVTFASPSAVTYLLDGLMAEGLARDEARALLARAALVAIGPTTAGALRDAGLPVASVAEPHTAEGLVAALIGLFAATGPAFHE
jgi:uroporphyrinogen-III synthase